MDTIFVERPGYVDVFASPAEVEAMRATAAEPLSLTGRALCSLRAFFDGKGHHPSDEHWVALWAIARTMEDMLDGTCAAKVHLSACDCGVGKSQTVVHFGRALVASPAHRGAGMIVSAFTIAEVVALAEALQDIRGSLCVLTSDAAANAMGGADANDAQVLITTQNRLGRLTENRPFASVTGFHYQGAPRACRVWDESALPGSVVIIAADDLLGLASRLRGFSPVLLATLGAFGLGLLNLEDAAAVDVPDFTACGIALSDLTAYLAADNGTADRSRDRETATSLLMMAGRRVRVRRDGLSGAALLTFKEELPADLLPMLVLDASGRVRETYPLWAESRKALAMLPAAVRDYRPLTVKVWKTSGAKSGWERNGDKLIEGIVATILTKPAEDWLVVVHRPNGAIGDVEKAIRAKLPPEVRDHRVSFTTWGRHTGSNAWADVPNVILAGTLFYPASHLTALHHLCANIPVEDGLVGRDDVNRTQRGEHRHLILQAVCRGRVRRSDGARCQAMTAYVIASPKSGIGAEMATVFPGCVVEPWQPLKAETKGKLKEAIEWLTDALEGGRTEVSYVEVYTAIGSDKAYFSRRITKEPAWKAAIDALDSEVVRGPRGALLVRLLAAEG